MDWQYILAIVVTVALGVVAIIQGFKLVRKKRPSWAYTTYKMIGLGSNTPPELKVMFGNVLVNEVYKTTLIFFNRGKEPIRAKEDIIKPVSICFNNAQILREPIVHPNEKSNNIGFTAKRNNDCVDIKFKCLDYEDGAVIEVFHTKGDAPKFHEWKILGTTDIENLGVFVYFSLNTLEKVFACLCVPIGILVIVVFVLNYIKSQWFESNWFLLFYAALGFLAGAVTASFRKYLKIRKFPSWSRKPWNNV